MTPAWARWQWPPHGFLGLGLLVLLLPVPSLTTQVVEKENCKLSCFMDGLYFDLGDKWRRNEEPCVTYQCFESGYFQVVDPACDFKGTCYSQGQTWTEGCFTYTCEEVDHVPRYRLTQGGCADEKGNCYLVGDRFAQECETLECQVVDGCYSLTKVLLGCVSAEGCRALNDFWHDTCTVYQCALDNLNSIGIIKEHRHDVMMWPVGEYALPMPKAFCPSEVKAFWKDGYRIQYGEGANFYSQRFDLNGTFTDDQMSLHFCVHQNITKNETMPFYQTYWERGRYCILRKGSACPKGFEEGFLRMIDEPRDDNETLKEGELPDGEFNETTLLQFCCRSDGDLKDPIVLPTRHPFFLFMANNETYCQSVRGMNYTIEFFSFDDADGGILREINGTVPTIKTGDNSTLVYLCYYEPISCGCVTTDSELVALGDRITENCVVRECREEYSTKFLAIVEGGCQYEGQCMKENVPWMVTSGETCITKVCIRNESAPQPAIEFVVEEFVAGCRDGDVCRPLGYVTDKGCFKTRCQNSTVPDRPQFVVFKSGCSDGKGGCIDEGEHLTQDCVEYFCEKDHTACGMKPFKGGCRFNEHCYQVNETWTDRCLTYMCSEFRNATHFQWTVLVVEKGCPGADDKCYAVGDRMEHSCWTHECVYQQDYWGFIPVRGGCLWRGKCIAANYTWTESCSQYRCFTFVNDTHLIWEVQPVSLGCHLEDNTTCIQAGEFVKQGCSTFECRRSGKECGLYMIEAECRLQNGSCIAVGNQYRSGCINYECRDMGQYIGIRPVKGGCVWKDGCLAVNQTVNDTCSTYTCQEVYNETVYRWSINSTGGCNVNGTCYKTGERFSTQQDAFCFTYECNKGSQIYKNTGCMSIDGTCVPSKSQTTFEMRLNYNGHEYKGTGCKCTVDDNNQVSPNCDKWNLL